jgi:putative CocE/NonD family hydrolase
VRGRISAGLIVVATVATTMLVGKPAQAAYTPVGKCNVPIKMTDGATMRANVAYPKERGRYPLVLEITGYNKDASGYGGNCSPVNADLVSKGYAAMVVDDRGTGASEGRWDRYGPRTRKDYGEILDWIQRQPWSNGKVGTTGTSYSAGTATMIAIEDVKRVHAGKPRAVRALWTNLVMSDMYRDYPHVGGFTNLTFTGPWLGLVGGTSAPPPTTTGGDPNAPMTWVDHQTNAKDMQFPLTVGTLLGGDKAYDGDWYHSHSPGTGSELIDVPFAWTGGWYDIFLRGEVDYWTRLKRAPVKKMWMNPIYHVGGANHFDEQGYGTQAQVVQKWWDRWLKGKRNNVEKLPNVNLFVMGAERWYHGKDWPKVDYKKFYLSGNLPLTAPVITTGALSTRVSPSMSDTLPFSTMQGLCSRSPAHWGLGVTAPTCETDNRKDEWSGLTYTTDVMRSDLAISGRMTADFWAEVSAPDTAFVLRVTDVAPDGTSTEVGGGWLVGRHNAIDWKKTVRGPKGEIVRPYHPFTQGAEKLLTPNIPTRFLIEVYPTTHTFKKGHQMRIAVTTSDYPAMAVPEPWLQQMLGGEIRLLRGPDYPSHMLLPVVRTH